LSYSLDFRHDIHNLRAIAVSSVFLYHLHTELQFSQFFKMGFLGVDIFFVISGYLISKILVDQVEQNGEINFSEFYKRRVKRIIPATLFLLILVNITTAFFGTKTYIDNIYENTISAILFIPNLQFMISNIPYGGEDNFTPLLNLWSLGVEEQFYLVFPFFIFLVFKKKLNIYKTTCFFIALSFSAFFLTSFFMPSVAFYFSPMRAWEILFGTLAYLTRKRLGKISLYRVDIFCIPALISIIAFGNGSAVGSVILNLIVVFLTFILLTYNDVGLKLPKTKPNKKGAFLKSVQYIASISFSLYLFHYPIIQFVKINFFGYSTLFLSAISLTLSIFFGSLSYYLIEEKFKVKDQNFKIQFIFLAITSLICLTGSFYNANYSKFSNENLLLDTNWRNAGDINAHIKNWHSYRLNNQPKNFTTKSNKKNILVVGNSLGSDFYYVLKNSVNSENFNLSYISPPINREYDGNYRLDCFLKQIREDFGSRICEGIDYSTGTLDPYNLYKNADAIIIASRYLENDKIVLPQLIKTLKLDGKAVFIVSPAPEFKSNSIVDNEVKSFIFKKRRVPNKLELSELEKKVFENYSKNTKINAWLDLSRKLAKEYDVVFINRLDLQCNKITRSCPQIVSDVLLVSDYGHLTPKGMEFFSRFGQKELNKIFNLEHQGKK